MRSLNDLIKEIAVKAVQSTDPCEIYYGTLHTDPVRVEISPDFELSAEFLVFSESLNLHNYHIVLKHPYQGENLVSAPTLQVERRLKEGDQVLLMKMQGGQKYIVLDKAIDGTDWQI